jgi:hypothetical protein
MLAAELHLYAGFSDSIGRKRVAWLESPVIHYHGYFKASPHYFNATYVQEYLLAS